MFAMNHGATMEVVAGQRFSWSERTRHGVWAGSPAGIYNSRQMQEAIAREECGNVWRNGGSRGSVPLLCT
jgi:hypothetical protein